VVDAKIQAVIDTVIAAMTPDEIADLRTHGVDSEVFARLAHEGDPYWSKAIVVALQ